MTDPIPSWAVCMLSRKKIKHSIGHGLYTLTAVFKFKILFCAAICRRKDRHFVVDRCSFRSRGSSDQRRRPGWRKQCPSPLHDYFRQRGWPFRNNDAHWRSNSGEEVVARGNDNMAAVYTTCWRQRRWQSAIKRVRHIEYCGGRVASVRACAEEICCHKQQQNDRPCVIVSLIRNACAFNHRCPTPTSLRCRPETRWRWSTDRKRKWRRSGTTGFVAVAARSNGANTLPRRASSAAGQAASKSRRRLARFGGAARFHEITWRGTELAVRTAVGRKRGRDTMGHRPCQLQPKRYGSSQRRQHLGCYHSERQHRPFVNFFHLYPRLVGYYLLTYLLTWH